MGNYNLVRMFRKLDFEVKYFSALKLHNRTMSAKYNVCKKFFSIYDFLIV